MHENITQLYGESIDIKAFFDIQFQKTWNEKRELKKAKRANPIKESDLNHPLSGITNMLSDSIIRQAYSAAKAQNEQQTWNNLRDQLISNSVVAIGLRAFDEGIKTPVRIAPEVWIEAEVDIENNLAQSDFETFTHIRILSDLYERELLPHEHIIIAIRHLKNLHETKTGQQWWGVQRKTRIKDCREFIKQTFGVNTLKDDGYSPKHFDKYFSKFRSQSMY